MIRSIPVKETRSRLADLVNDVYFGRKSYIITKFGKPRAMLVPIIFPPAKQKKSGIAKSFGMWRNRKDMKNTEVWVRKVRTKLSLRK